MIAIVSGSVLSKDMMTNNIKRIVLGLCVLIGLSVACAAKQSAVKQSRLVKSKPTANHRVDLTGSAVTGWLGYRHDDLKWAVLFPPQFFNKVTGEAYPVFSELTWRAMRTIYIGGSGQYQIRPNIYLLGSANYGYIASGQVQDSDYLSANRFMEYSRSLSDIYGQIYHLTGGVGYRLVSYGSWWLMPEIGGLDADQNLAMSMGEQVVSQYGIGAPLGRIYGLHSSYDAKWRGGYLGLNMVYAGSPVTIKTGLQYQLLNFKAVADWNLRGNFQHPVSFRQSAKGYGLLASIDFIHHLKSGLSMDLLYSYQYRHTQTGTDVLYLTSGEASNHPLDPINATTYTVMLGLSRRF